MSTIEIRPPRVDDKTVFDRLEVAGEVHHGCFMLRRLVGDLGYAGTVMVVEISGEGRCWPLGQVTCLYRVGQSG